ncbi:MAG: hypothetical protein QGG36_32490 [Pirellulaceae bacterium]|jgi:gluconolactonase|nr:hypothetical protein [Pirellulaceae bacterium]MDP7020564.1 hypothetical protein [Pirellulaceae bacterium]
MRLSIRRAVWLCSLTLAALASATTQANADDAKTTDVKIKDITLSVPSGWKKEEPKTRLRLAQFSVPAAEGDKESAELAIFSFGASDPSANIRRWLSQFQAKDRKASVATGVSAVGKYVFVDISGTYNKPVGPPVAGKTEPTPNSRVLAVILVAEKKGVYYLKMAGPDKTVAAQADALRKSFGGDAEKEKVVDTEKKQ